MRLKASIQTTERPDAKAIARFMAKVDTYGPEAECGGRCWLWTAYACRKGYGQFHWNGRMWWAYQIAYLIFNGPLNEGMHRAHKCHNAACVNPDHVEETTPGENVAERNRRYAAAATADDEPPF